MNKSYELCKGVDLIINSGESGQMVISTDFGYLTVIPLTVEKCEEIVKKLEIKNE